MANTRAYHPIGTFTLSSDRVAENFSDGVLVKRVYNRDFTQAIQDITGKVHRIDYAHSGPRECSIVSICSSVNCRKSFKFKAYRATIRAGGELIFFFWSVSC
jgi:hypothetical protein